MPLNHPGKLSYIQIPAQDPQALGAFYRDVFGWTISGRPEHVSFEDASGELIGAFMTGRTPASEAGFLPYIYVEGVEAALIRVVEAGGQTVLEPYPEGNLTVATFKDSDGNLLGLWEMGG